MIRLVLFLAIASLAFTWPASAQNNICQDDVPGNWEHATDFAVAPSRHGSIHYALIVEADTSPNYYQPCRSPSINGYLVNSEQFWNPPVSMSQGDARFGKYRDVSDDQWFSMRPHSPVVTINDPPNPVRHALRFHIENWSRNLDVVLKRDSFCTNNSFGRPSPPMKVIAVCYRLDASHPKYK